MWAAQCLDNMTGLYPGLDGFLPNTLTETVNTCLDFMIEAVKNKGVTFVVYILHIHTHTHKQNTNTHTHKRMYKLRLINMEVKSSLKNMGRIVLRAIAHLLKHEFCVVHFFVIQL